MKISINKDGQNVIIEMMPVKGRELKQGWIMLSELQKLPDGQEAEAAIKYRDWRDGLAARLCSMSTDDLDELDVDEKLKIVSVIDQKLRADLGFMKP